MSSRPRAVPETASLDAALAAIEQAIRETPVEGLPELAAALAGLSARIALRLTATPEQTSAWPERLWTAEETAAVLRISVSETYRRSKSDLRSASVMLGPGTLRFDPEKVRRFIRARTGLS